MFAKIFTTAILASSAMGAVIPRDLPTITNALTSIGNQIEKLTTDINNWDGTSAGAAIMTTDSTALQKIISDSTAAIKASSDLQLAESIGLLGPSQVLTGKTDALAAAMISKADAYKKLGIAKEVAAGITSQEGNSKALEDAIFSKLPAIAQSFGANAAAGVTGKLSDAVAILSGQTPAVVADASGNAGMAAMAGM